jgi:signal transduction histidine kinase
MKADETKSKRKTGSRGFFSELQVEFLVHELKDPVAVIETGARALLEKAEKYGPITERQEKTLQRILRSTRKAREMIYELLEVGRSEAGYCACCRFEPVRVIHEAIADALEILPGKIPENLRSRWGDPAAGAFLADIGIRMSIDADTASFEMDQDETKFRQIIGNLIKNGLYHRSKRLDIRVERPDPETLCVMVTDDGPGIDPKHHRLIFERYAQVDACATVDRKGHGLGLAGALVLARCMGGEIAIDSNKGKGATFRLTLPLLPDDADE